MPKPAAVPVANPVPPQAPMWMPFFGPDVQDGSDSEDSDFAGDIVDSDNEVGKDDDDLFYEWVDPDAENVAAGGKVKLPVQDDNDSDYDTDELNLPDSEFEDDKESDEGSEAEKDDDSNSKKKKKRKKKKVKLRSFRPEDMQFPKFTLGMVFSTVGDLRKAITEYIIQNRVPIKYAKNDKQRVRAHGANQESVDDQILLKEQGM